MRELQLHMGDCLLLMEDLFQCGILAVQEDTLKQLRQLSQMSKQYGLMELGNMQEMLCDRLSAIKHQMNLPVSEKMEILYLYSDIIRYLELGYHKTGFDEARLNLNI